MLEYKMVSHGQDRITVGVVGDQLLDHSPSPFTALSQCLGARRSLEQDGEVRAREAVAQERARITRELHDIIGHTLSLIVVQVGAARAVFKSRQDQTLESLKTIDTTWRQSLSDMELLGDKN